MSNYRKTMTEALREMYPLDESVIDKVKEIASKKSAAKIDGVMVDSFTASAISQIYDKVNDANKKKMDSLPITKLANLAMKMMQKNEFVPEEVELDEKAPKIKKTDFMRDRGKKAGPQTYQVDIKGVGRATVKAANEKMAIQKAMTQMKVNKNIKPLPKATVKVMEETDLDEGKMKDLVIKGQDLEMYAKKSGGIDKNDMMKVAAMLKKGNKSGAVKYAMKLDTDPKEYILNLIGEEVEVEEGAAADARRAMRADPDMRQRAFSKDNSATDDDVKGASKNIMMQMRKAQSLNGRFDVEFADGKKVKIPAKMAMAVQSKYNKMRRPAEKEKFQAKIAKSYRDMLSALKEAVSPAQQAAIAISKKERGEKPKKESVLDRIDKKIKEKNDG